MKKTVLALLILFALLMLFSCSSDKVEPPTPTRPDLDLPIPVKYDPFEQHIHESRNWKYDPDPNDNVRIYGGTYDNVTFVLTLDDSIASLAVMVSEKVTKAELIYLGLDGSNYTCSTVYSLSELAYSFYDSDSSNILLKADSFQMHSKMNIQSSGGADTNEFVTKRTALLNEMVQNKMISQSEAESKKAYLNGKTAVTVGSSLNISVLLDEEKGVCRVDSIDCMIDGKQHKLTHTFSNVVLKNKTIDVESVRSKTVKFYGHDIFSKSSLEIDSFYHSDGTVSSVNKETYLNGEIRRFSLMLENDFEKFTIQFFDDGEIGGQISYFSVAAKESSASYYKGGKIKSEYYVEGNRGYEISYYQDGTKQSEAVCEINAKTLRKLKELSYTVWYENGSVRSETKTEDGKTLTKAYSENGTLLEHYEKEGNTEITTKYYNNGNKKSQKETNYKNNSGIGSVTSRMEWYENGTLKYELSADLDGFIHYERKYSENGVLIFERTNVEPPIESPAIIE